jgi:hypothetical protein
MLARILRYLNRHHVALLALFVALGGTSYAVSSLPRGSVGSPQLRSGSVTGSKLARGAVTDAKVKQGSLTARAFKRGTLPRGPQGLPGSQGPPGPQGTPGPAGASPASVLLGRVPSSLVPSSGGTSAFDPAGDAAGIARGFSPAVPVVLRDLAVFVQSAPGVGHSFTVKLGVSQFGGDANPAISCTIRDTATTCDTGGQTVTIPAKSEINLSVQNVGAAQTELRYAYTAVSLVS